MKKLLIILMLVSPVFCFAQKTTPKTYDLLIGTYTRRNGSKGIYVYRFYAETGKVAYLSEIDGIDNPSYLAVSKDYKFVYSANEGKGQGSVGAFKFDVKTGKLDSINQQPGHGSPAYIAIDKDQKNVFTANYAGGSLTVYPVAKDGSLGPMSQKIQDEGSSIDKKRQEGPHVHTAMLSPDGKYLLYTDLGTDKINIYRYKASKNPPLTPASPAFVSAIPGNGPRHLEFSPNGKFLYNVQEMGSAVTAYKYDDGKLTAFQTVTMLADGFTGAVGAADIHISPDGLFLYATNRGAANEIVTYSINQANGELTFVARNKVGKAPRNFIIEPAGNFLLVANQDSNNILIFKRDKTTGKLTLTPSIIEIGAPVCLKLVPVE
ncbi:lactonase family protein [Mucilaginibacter sp.]|uniref:lactonase family protein n=1 Tax=Mucilaginibacter sp. TaxID=1882438 RepID=UPI002616C8F3|nr:lactonase family protein [Mucilaginibacter sp.]MDB4924815.1 3-carboxymuconate cyclase [Mucilaginibacter sp.]